MVYFVDTNIFLRTLVKEDEKSFRECYSFLDLIKKRKILAFTSSLVVAEIDWVLESFYKFDRLEVIRALGSILRLKGLKIIDKFNLKLALKIFKEKNVKFIDALIASNPAIFRKEVIVISYDKDFDKIGLKRIEPKKLFEKFDK